MILIIDVDYGFDEIFIGLFIVDGVDCLYYCLICGIWLV